MAKKQENELSLDSIKENLGSYNVRDFFRYLRNLYLAKRGYRRLGKRNEKFESILKKIAETLRVKRLDLWGTQKFQLLFRATKLEHLKMLGIDKKRIKEAEKAVESGRVMSLLPFNSVMGEDTIKKYIPSRSEKFSGCWRHSMDPYGIFTKAGKIIAIKKNGEEIYLATRKFPYAVLANITEACHIGCDGCYKGAMVRTSLSALADVYPEYAKVKKQLSLEEKRVVKQTKLLVKWLNKNPEVDTVVLSGGEPTLFSNKALRGIIKEYKKAKYIKVLRMCTSAVFQGMWFRIDNELAKIFSDFEKETGRQFYINAHVTDDYQLSAPEAKMALDKLQRAGISVHLQMPVQEGINFKRNDLKWSVNKIRKISKLTYCLDANPYKMIVDMHSPSHPDLTVPIETLTKAIGFLDQHLNNSDMERWQAYNVLHEQGNLYLSAYPHFTALKEIDKENKRVIYFIPKVEFNGKKKIVIHTYEEPIIRGQNDNPNSLNIIADKEIKERIERVRKAYLILKLKIKKLEATQLTFSQKAKEIGKIEKNFYKLSGIVFPENKPLIID